MCMQSMSSMEMDHSISVNIPLTQIIIPEPYTQKTLNNISDLQIDPLINSLNNIIDNIGNITLQLGVGPYIIINTSAPQVLDPSPSSPKASRPKKST